jgi:nitronate monooxygenase
MSLEKSFCIKNISNVYPIIQGGMGAGISMAPLASAVGIEGGIGTVSSAALDQLTPLRLGKKERMPTIDAVAAEVAEVKENAGIASINIMRALDSTFEDSICGAVEGKVDMIISGAGFPVDLPELVEKYAGKDHGIALVPIVSKPSSMRVICKKWQRKGYVPDAVVVEGPKAGGHIGFSYKDISKAGDEFLKKYDLFDELLDTTLALAKVFGDGKPIPVIAAGGIYTHEDIVYALERGAAAVQMGSRFAVTKESSASDEFKSIIINSGKDDFKLGDEEWGSACRYPFRYEKNSPLVSEARNGNPHFCICTALMSGTKYKAEVKTGKDGRILGCPEGYARFGSNPCPAVGSANPALLVTGGTEAYRITEELTVKELMKELVG